MTPAQIHAFLSDLNAVLIKHGVDIELDQHYDCVRIAAVENPASRGMIGQMVEAYGGDGQVLALVETPEATCTKCGRTSVAAKIGENCYWCRIPIVAWEDRFA